MKKQKAVTERIKRYLSALTPEKVVGVGGLAVICSAILLGYVPSPGQSFAGVLKDQLEGLGLNVLSGILTLVHQKLLEQPSKNDLDRLTQLARILDREIKREAKLRVEIGNFLEINNAFQIAEEVVKGNPAIHGWLLTNIYTDLRQHRDDFKRIHNRLDDRLDELKKLMEDLALGQRFSTPPLTSTAPAPPSTFVGRQELLDQLKTAIIGGQATAITALQGMGGIGKTATALQLADELKSELPGGIFWGSLADHNGNPASILRAWGRACGQDLSIEPDQVALANQVRNLLSHRQAEQGPLLIIVDDVRQEWIAGAQLLKQTIPSEASFLLTTRNENLAAVLGATVHRLDKLPPGEALDLLKIHAGLAAVEAEQSAAKKLLAVVGYLPLAIKLVGKRLAILARKPGHQLAVFGEVVAQRAIQALHLDGHPGLAATFTVTYEDLTTEVQQLFRWLGVFADGPLYVSSVAGVLEWDEAQAEQVLDQLVHLALLDWGKTPGSYTIHPLLRQYVQILLIKADEIAEARKQHLVHYLKYAQANAEDDPAAYDRLELALPNLLSAVDCAVEIKAHQLVKMFGFTLYGNSGFLYMRGYSREAVDVLEKSVNACHVLDDPHAEDFFLGKLGDAYLDLGQVERAIGYFEQALAIAQEIGDQEGEGANLGRLGDAYQVLGQVERAIGYFEQALAIAQEIGDRQGEGVSLNGLGKAYRVLGQMAKAIGYFEQGLVIMQEVGDRKGESAYLDNLGIAYRALGQVRKAIGYFERALSIDREIEYRQAEGSDLGNLGNAYFTLGQEERAIGYHKQALAIFQEIDFREGEANCWSVLGTIYGALGQMERAIGYIERALAISREIGDRHGEAVSLGNLGNFYNSLGQAERAIGYIEQALVIAQGMGFRQGEGRWLDYLGDAYRALGQMERAIGYHEQALAIGREIGDRQGEANSLGNLGNFYNSLGQAERAIGYYEQALAIGREIGDRQGEANSLAKLGRSYQKLGQMAKAKEYLERALRIFEEIKSSNTDLVRKWLDELSGSGIIK